MRAGRQLDALNSEERWRAVRRYLDRHRNTLAGLADQLYPDLARVGSTRLLCRADWLPSAPLALDRVDLAWIADGPAPDIRGTERTSTHLRPLQRSGDRHSSYAETIKALNPPKVFEDRSSYRLLDADLSSRAGQLYLCAGSYFDGVNVGEAVAHELAAAAMENPEAIPPDCLPFRASVGSPIDLHRRAAIPAISALTIRRDTATGAASFMLHWRDPGKVAHAGGLYQVMPVGIFQPSADQPWNERNDFDLWRCMVREYAEEFLGASEDHGGHTAPVDYEGWHLYQELTAARRADTVRVYCLGLGVDPLTLATDILVVTVIDHDIFDRVFDEIVDINAEGRVVNSDAAVGVPFTAASVRRFASGKEPMQAAGAAILELAWRHRDVLFTGANDRKS